MKAGRLKGGRVRRVKGGVEEILKGEGMEVGWEGGKRLLREECVVVGGSKAGREAGNQREGW